MKYVTLLFIAAGFLVGCGVAFWVLFDVHAARMRMLRRMALTTTTVYRVSRNIPSE